MNIEALLINKIGDTGAMLHTARSRKDQVATGMHLYVKEEIGVMENCITELQGALLRRAQEHPDVIMSGYIYMQPAQPVLFGLHLLAHFFMLQRDVDRLRDCCNRSDQSPLGCGALAGTWFPIGREFTARELGLSSIYDNSIDPHASQRSK